MSWWKRDIEIVEERELSLAEQLVEAKANVARLRKLPLSEFAEKSHKAMRYTSFGPITYSVDNKDDAISRAEAAVAYLEVKIKGRCDE